MCSTCSGSNHMYYFCVSQHIGRHTSGSYLAEVLIISHQISMSKQVWFILTTQVLKHLIFSLLGRQKVENMCQFKLLRAASIVGHLHERVYLQEPCQDLRQKFLMGLERKEHPGLWANISAAGNLDSKGVQIFEGKKEPWMDQGSQKRGLFLVVTLGKRWSL